MALNGKFFIDFIFTLVLLNSIYSAFANSVDTDQLASEEATDLDLPCLPFCH